MYEDLVLPKKMIGDFYFKPIVLPNGLTKFNVTLEELDDFKKNK